MLLLGLVLLLFLLLAQLVGLVGLELLLHLALSLFLHVFRLFGPAKQVLEALLDVLLAAFRG